MDALSAILSRRSIRHYTSQKVSPENIRTLLEAAVAAPSGNHKEPWHFVVITERSILDAVTDFHPYSRMLLEAPLAILVCGDTALETRPDYMVEDLSAAAENILIAVQALGLGAVWLGIFPREERMAGMKDLLKIPDGILPLALISIGYPAEELPPSNRYDEARVHHNEW